MAKAAILGFGTVGSGVAEVLQMNREDITRRIGEPLELKSIVEIRDFSGTPWAPYIVKDFAQVEADPEITVVAETMGGTGIAYEFTRRALLAGKNVVTSNKALVAKHGAELLALAKAHGVRYLFEASVGGGIPILRPLTSCLTAEHITGVYGILNGTTNYILTRMDEDGASFADALAEAQKLGYAEADPTADVDGIDAVRKICILANLCWGKGLDAETLSARGIRAISREDVALARQAGYAIKLIGRAGLTDAGSVYAFVEPQLISHKDPVSHIDGVTNVVAVEGNAVGRALFCGPGAGKLPTASAVVGDMIEAVSAPAAPIFWTDPVPGDTAPAKAADALEDAWFVRMEGACPVPGASKAAAEGSQCAYVLPAMTRAAAEKALSAVSAYTLLRILPNC